MHLVIGASGYAGRNAAAELSRHELVRTAEPWDDLAAAMRGVEVVHLAFDLRSPLERQPRPRVAPHPLLVSLVRLARGAGVRRMVCLSSAHLLGFTKDGRVSERTRPRPVHRYEKLVAADDAWLREQFEPEIVILRPAQGFGPGEPVLSRLLRGLAPGPLLLPSRGRAPRTFLAGADLGRAFHAAAERGVPGTAYLLGGLRGSWWELVLAAARALSLDAVWLTWLGYDLAYLAACARLPMPGGQRSWLTPFMVDLLSRPQLVEDGWSRRELGWAPAVDSFAAGLVELPEWHRAAAPGLAAAAGHEGAERGAAAPT